ncbi:MAG: hypothetical protein NC099_03365 [Corallococcus sp.]|nr:hypothetical protein [Corallococcus sp.]
MKKNKPKEEYEVTVYDGYDVEESLDMTDDFGDEEPIVTEEVKIRFE